MGRISRRMDMGSGGAELRVATAEGPCGESLLFYEASVTFLRNCVLKQRPSCLFCWRKAHAFLLFLRFPLFEMRMNEVFLSYWYCFTGVDDGYDCRRVGPGSGGRSAVWG